MDNGEHWANARLGGRAATRDWPRLLQESDIIEKMTLAGMANVSSDNALKCSLVILVMVLIIHNRTIDF